MWIRLSLFIVERLNCHHLLYFWAVVHEGGVSKVAGRLRAWTGCRRCLSCACGHGREAAGLYGVRTVGQVEATRERYYAISAERRRTHLGVLAITSAARDDLLS